MMFLLGVVVGAVLAVLYPMVFGAAKTAVEKAKEVIK